MSRRALVIAAALSVALNLFFLGVFAARAWQRSEWHGPRVGHGAAAGPRRVPGRPHADPLAWLSDAERAELHPRRQALRDLRRQAEASLRAEPYDGRKLEGTLDALRVETDAIQANLHALLARRAASSSPEERGRLADVHWRGNRERGRRPPPRE